MDLIIPSLIVLGHFTQILTYRRTSKQQIYFFKGLKNNLLGLPAIQALQLVSQLDSLESYQTRILAEYPSVFNGLGVLAMEISHMRSTWTQRPNHMPSLLHREYHTQSEGKLKKSSHAWNFGSDFQG